MGFDISIVTHPLGTDYQLITVAVPLLSSITFSNWDYVLFCTVV